MSEPLTAEQSKAARALLAWSQQELAAAANVGVSTVADFERGMRTPVANNAQAIREAFEAQGLQFIAGGVVEKAMLPPPPPAGRPGGLVRWVNATHLSQWGESREGQSGMPELLRRLIYAELGPAAVVRFPSDESVQYPGWDGVCAVSAGGNVVPDGESVWEIGAQRSGIRAKADKDYVKRTADPLGRDPRKTTFVFVTPQRFVGKEDWVAEKMADGRWRKVIAIDGDDLVHWLEAHPAVAQWLSVKIGRRPPGLRNLEETWAEWVRATQTPLTPDVVLTSRDAEQTAVLKWLRGAPRLLSIQAEAPEEAVAFLYAAISHLPQSYRLHYWSRCVVADTAETARELVGLGTPMIIVLTEPDAGLAQRLVDDDHHVFAAYGPDANAFTGAHRLHRPWKFDLQQALVAAGVEDVEAHRLAHTSGRSITVLRRLMPAAPSAKPKWAEAAPPELIAAMFAGAWVETSAKDRKIVSELAGRPYDQVETVLAQLAANLGGPIVRLGSVWKVVSLRDLWVQIGGQVTTAQFARFEKAVQTVLGAVNPRYAKRPKNAYFESDGEFGEENSGAIRRGLTEAMIAMAVFPEQAGLITKVDGRIERLVHKLLENASPALWWSLAGDFRNLAETSPDAFLDALETGLEGESPTVQSLFRSDEGLMNSTEYLSNLLWALEALARSKDYLTRTALVLAQLDAIDPGGKWGNRPGASLRRIFVTWSPQTYATPAQRLKVIDKVVRQDARVGWKLLLALAPRFHDTSEPSSMPQWRDFAPDEPEIVTWEAVAEASRAIGDRLLDQTGDDGERWRSLLDLWANFDPDWRKGAVKQLRQFARSLSDPNEIERMRDKLRELLQHHRAYKKADWAMAERDLKALDAVFDILQPVGVEDRVRWRFRPGAARVRADMDWQAQREELEAEQILDAIDLMGALSEDGLFAFAETVTMRNDLGVAIAKAGIPDAAKLALLKRALLADAEHEVEVGMGLLFGLKVEEDESWVRALWAMAIEQGWGERAEMRIVHALPPTASTWADIEARSPGLTDAYWRTLNVYAIPKGSDPVYVADHMAAVGRNRAAMGWLGHHIEAKPPGDILIRIMRAAAGEAASTDSNDAVMLSHFAGVILNYLETAPGVTDQDIVSLEWIYYQALHHSPRPARTLQRALARDPDFFVHLLSMVYHPAEDSGVEEPEPNPEDAEAASNMASQAWSVLREWHHIPGADDHGVVDAAALESWVKRARKRLAEVGRTEIGDSKIGEILSAARRDADQPWPPEPVREIIEMARSRALERGFEVGLYNRRGVTVRMPHDGGAQERALAGVYQRDAEALRFDWPRTAACLDRIATTYQVDAEREDLSADQRDWL
jgi:transcriptional regulator with XRE-family HTH domain